LRAWRRATGQRRFRRFFAAWALVALVGCGGGGHVPAEPTDDVARLQPGDRPVRFRLDTAVSEDVKRSIVETLAWAHTDLGDSGPLTVHVYSDEEHFVTAYTSEFDISAQDARRQLEEGQTAFESPGGHIWIYLTNYEDAPVDERRLALFHEYEHTAQDWQAELRFQSAAPSERSFVPRWLVEGCAEYLAVQAGSARGFADAGRERDAVVTEAKASGVSIESLESGGEAEFLGGSGQAYTLGWLGCERLALASGPASVAHQFWLSMAKLRDWRPAFADAFGVSVTAFYGDFDAFLATL
jgi:hypothetical protein